MKAPVAKLTTWVQSLAPTWWKERTAFPISFPWPPPEALHINMHMHAHLHIRKTLKRNHSFFFKIYLFIYMYMNMPLLSSDTPEEGTGSHYRWLGATMWLLGIELRTSGCSYHCAISPALSVYFHHVINYNTGGGCMVLFSKHNCCHLHQSSSRCGMLIHKKRGGLVRWLSG